MKEIELKNVNKIYKSEIVALEDVSLSIEQGEFVFVTGRSGSGKSTLLKLLSGQIFPTSGEVWVRGHNAAALTHKELPYYRRQFGIMQADMGLLKEQNVQQNIELAMYATEQSYRLAKKRVRQTLNTVGIPEKRLAMPGELSGGQIARVLLARALATEPEILILDEPTANLDSSASWDLMCLLEEINRIGITVIVACHDRELVTIMKKRVITFAAGVKVADAKSMIYDATVGDIFEERRILKLREERNNL